MCLHGTVRIETVFRLLDHSVPHQKQFLVWNACNYVLHPSLSIRFFHSFLLSFVSSSNTHFYETRSFTAVFTTASHLNLVHIISYLFKVHFNIIIPSISYLSFVYPMSRLFHLHRFDHSNTCWKGTRYESYRGVIFVYFPVAFSLLCVNILARNVF